MFVRVKKIKRGEYAYLVENSWKKGSSRQKVKKYLGRVLRPPRLKSEGLAQFLQLDSIESYLTFSEFRKIVADLVLLELSNHSVAEVKLNTKSCELKDNKNKEVVLRINEGFLTSETVRALMSYDGKGDYYGFRLADLITAAGIGIEKEVFVGIFEKVRDANKESPQKIDFYY